MKRFYREGKLAEHWIKRYSKGNYNRRLRAYLQEKGKYHPDNMLPNGDIDESLE
jgi:hypothetical protein